MNGEIDGEFLRDFGPHSKYIDDLDEIKAMLLEWRGKTCNARLWHYSASHRTLTIRVTATGRNANFHLVLTGTYSLTCQEDWDNAQFSVVVNDQGQAVVADEAGGFCAVGDSLRLITKVPPLDDWSEPFEI